MYFFIFQEQFSTSKALRSSEEQNKVGFTERIANEQNHGHNKGDTYGMEALSISADRTKQDRNKNNVFKSMDKDE